MYRVSPVIFGFLKKNPPVTDENLSRCTDGISLRRLEDHLGPEKKCGFPMAFPKKSWDTHRKIEMLGETCLEIVKKKHFK